MLDYDEIARVAHECKPKMIIAGFSAYSQILDFPRFRAIADKVMAVIAAEAGGNNPLLLKT